MNTWIVFGHRFVGVLWLAWLAYWIAAARHTATNRRKESSTLITVGTLSCLVGFVTIFISVVCKLALEEKWLRAQFGEEYEDYRRRVKALVPHP
jgi:protein-S-isoprenylcysteine O-methyltransferase Ste14